MSNIVCVRDFTKNLRNYKSGDSVVIVDAVRRKMIAHVEFKALPEKRVQTIERIYST